jgi:acyl-CoA reductase-like NAD-dependent aldehyde dehydrogenase
VKEDIYDELIKKYIERDKNRKVGEKFNEKIEKGKKIDDEMLKKVMNIIK